MILHDTLDVILRLALALLVILVEGEVGDDIRLARVILDHNRMDAPRAGRDRMIDRTDEETIRGEEGINLLCKCL